MYKRNTLVILSALGLFAQAQNSIANNVNISGVVEIESVYGQDTEKNTSSDVALATVELGVDAQVSDGIETHILFLYEEDDTLLEVDEGTVSITNLAGLPLTFTAGQMYLPFGQYESNMVSDPLTLEIGEARESALQLSAGFGDLSSSIYVFNGESTGDNVKQYGANVGFTRENNYLSYDFGLSYISNIGDSDALQESVNLDQSVAGLGAQAIFKLGATSIILEYLTALDEMMLNETNNATPSAYNVEVAYMFSVASKDIELAASYQASGESAEFELPESRLLLGAGFSLMENTSLSFEWTRDTEYGSGDTSNLVTAQLAAEF